VQNLENFCQIFGILSSILGIFQSTFVGILHAGNIGHIWRKESETDICQVTLDIFGQTKFDSRLKTKLCNCDSQGSLFGKHCFDCLIHDKPLAAYQTCQNNETMSFHFTR